MGVSISTGSSVTLAHLLEVDSRAFEGAATAWERLAGDLDSASVGIGSGGECLVELAIPRLVARSTSEALRALADAVTDLRWLAQSLLESARTDGYLIDADTGRVDPLPCRHPGVSPDRLRRSATAKATEVRQLVELARNIDTWATRLIAVTGCQASPELP